ncbi:multidrug efflux pump membrane fusion lipoprotein AcrA [Hyphomicrobiales bacterium]|nr:multidrug efflux pump membrane fusion lipoprotein AcrA [Hyphomicrobiales bacterium]CAH1673128.1 multidrug efflux pump membrane fusion lipoprotein AcrA [Hyphomicrobiales bacterium]
MKSASLSARILAAAIFLPLALSNTTLPAAAESGATPPSAVSVVEVAAERIPIINELPGRIAPTRIAEVRPRVSGIVTERVFEQGSLVKPGDVLYRIDADMFRVRVESAKATLQRARATQVQARQQADRQKELRDRNIASVQQLESAVAALAQADADIAAAEAGLNEAQLNLQYTEVRAPIAGRIGRAVITEGALVSSAENLATIQQLNPVYADFTQSSNELLKLRQALASGSLKGPAQGEARVTLQFDDGRVYEHAGTLLFSEAAVDITTGQITMRAEFPNPDGQLLPGLYVRVQIEQGIQHDAVAVPQQAVQRDANGNAQVFVVTDKNIAEIRPVRVNRTVGERFVIDRGLKPGERVVVEGFQKIAPGATVSAQTWKAADASAAAAQKNTAVE